MEIQDEVLGVAVVYFGSGYPSREPEKIPFVEIWLKTKSHDELKAWSISQSSNHKISPAGAGLVHGHFRQLVGRKINLNTRDEGKTFTVLLPEDFRVSEEWLQRKVRQYFNPQTTGLTKEEIEKNAANLQKALKEAKEKEQALKKENPLLEREKDFAAVNSGGNFSCGKCGTEVEPTTWNKLTPEGLIDYDTQTNPKRIGNFVLDDDSKPTKKEAWCNDCLAKHPGKPSYTFQDPTPSVKLAKPFSFRPPPK